MNDKPETTDRIRDILMKNAGGLNIREIAQETGFNRMSVAKYLEVLTANGMVEFRFAGKAKVYHLSRRIPVITYMEYISKHYCITDSSLRVVQLNEWIPRTVGMRYEDFIGRTLPDVLKGVVVNLDECKTAMEKALAGEVSTIVVEENFRGTHMFFDMLHMPVQFPDGSRGMMAVSQDITDKKKLEIALRKEGNRFRDLVENNPDILFSADKAGIISYISPRIGEYGFLPGDLVGHPFREMAVPAEGAALMERLLAVQESGIVRDIRFQAAGPDGRKIWFEADCLARRDESGSCTGINGKLRDVTDRMGTGRAATARPK